MKYIILIFFLSNFVCAFGQIKVYSDSGSSEHSIIDTFIIKKNVFRIIEDTSENYDNKYLLQKFVNRQWMKRFYFGSGIGMHISTYSRNSDLNLDGCNDIIVYNRRSTEAYMYDTAKNEFINKSIIPPYEWTLIDSSKSLFCSLNLDVINMPEDEGVSLLYKFSNFKIYPFYYLLIKDKDDSGNKNCILYKCLNGDINKKIKISESEIHSDTYDFYVDYWQSKYKSLMGYR